VCVCVHEHVCERNNYYSCVHEIINTLLYHCAKSASVCVYTKD
jgi:hypothetical protein